SRHERNLHRVGARSRLLTALFSFAWYFIRPLASGAALLIDSWPGIGHVDVGVQRMMRCHSWASADRRDTYSITLSARRRSAGGIVRRIALAVLRLTTSSNFVGCSMGRPEGLAPFRIRST